VTAGGNPHTSAGKVYFLDRAWSEIQELLHSSGYPISQAIVGNALHPGAVPVVSVNERFLGHGSQATTAGW